MGEGFRRMRRKRVVLVGALALAVGVTAGAVVLASVPHSFTSGETLTAANLNGNFTALDQRIAALEAGLPSGMVVPFAGPSGVAADAGAAGIPAGWLLCDGSAVSRTTYAALFAAIGINYGGGDGIATFNLPDMRGRTVIGAGHGTGLTARTLAQTLGEEAHTLTAAEMPAHTHALTDPGHAHTVSTPAGGAFGVALNGNQCGVYCGTQQQSMAFAAATAGASTTGITIAQTGGSGAHNTMQPSMVLNY